MSANFISHKPHWTTHRATFRTAYYAAFYAAIMSTDDTANITYRSALGTAHIKANWPTFHAAFSITILPTDLAAHLTNGPTIESADGPHWTTLSYVFPYRPHNLQCPELATLTH